MLPPVGLTLTVAGLAIMVLGMACWHLSINARAFWSAAGAMVLGAGLVSLNELVVLGSISKFILWLPVGLPTLGVLALLNLRGLHPPER